ncbi:hypothetical protein LTR92_001817 [Exophiala xenobiotica]|uniref:Uncharacterized protein n=1 Tax=Vermiconidia calcicola TaxID=1690605 RepID=A0AAV9QQC5_9PEZI|nr:hypothetical protein LTR92_001817 [Exophiala xenobiotica]KAK5415324.1 hypothetical protein LTR90_006373 [Exophiala xenobiotica]KAK5545947.1 hypothetical protein LTR25_000957 [Vermiconidia calcicola]
MVQEKKPQSITTGSVVPLDVDDTQSNLRDPFLGSTQQHPFATPENAEYWSNIYEGAKYEGRHRFDPACQWDAAEEKRLVRKLDMRIMAWVWIMFSSLDLIRRNVNRAVSDNMASAQQSFYKA